MPKTTLTVDQFSRGLWVTSAKDSIPQGALRRARGMHSIPTRILRSRANDVHESDINAAHSLFRFGDVRFQGASTTLYRNAVSILTGLSGARLAFVRMPPTASVQDYLFLAGGDLARKIDTFGNVTNWGIEAPPDGFAAAAGTQQTKLIDGFEAAAGWTATNCTLSDEGTIKLFDTNSMQMDITAEDTVASARKAITLDLTTYGGTDAPLEDFIELWVRIEDPDNVDYIDVQFSVNGTAFNTDYYHYRIFSADNFTAPTQSTAQSLGIADLPGIHGSEVIFSEEAVSESQIDTSQGLSVIAQTQTLGAGGAWTRLRVPKAIFSRGGSTTANDWSDVAAMRLVVKTNDRGGTTVYFDRARLIGSVGLQGTYKYLVTFRNGTTGTRSNANPTPVVVDSVERQPVGLTNLPISSDTQVTQRELWRTFGGGSIYFRLAVINDNTTTVYTDSVADYAGLDSRTSATTLESTVLPDDNDVPSATYQDTWGPHQARVWWCRDSVAGARGRVYYSPAGRAEAVQGFLDVTNDDDPTQKGVTWNGANWVFSESRLFKIEGTTEPFIAREVFGVPGTNLPFTVVPTPFGIIYQSYDGVRAFDGVRSTLVAPEAVQTLFRGEDAENLTAFEGVVAAYINNEYYISDGDQTLVVNLQSGTWRDLGTGYTALYAEPDTGLLLGGQGIETVIVESEQAGGNTVEFEIEVPSFDFETVPTLVEAIYVDITANDNVSVHFIRDDQAELLTQIGAGDRQVQVYQIDEMARRAGVRLSASLQDSVTVHSIAIQVRDIPLALLINGKIATALERSFSVVGECGQLSDRIVYRGLDNTIALDNSYQVPFLRRLYLDLHAMDEQIMPRLVFYNSTIDLPPFTASVRTIAEWDISRAERLVRIELIGDWTTATLYQATLDVQIGEA